MHRRQLPRQWLITDPRLGDRLIPTVRRLPKGCGVLIRHHQLKSGERQRLIRAVRRLARTRGLVLMDEADGQVARVHNAAEIRHAQMRRVRILLLSPIHRTRSHPDWAPLPRMRAATLLRLARVPVVALGGMDQRRFARVQALGFHGWAGIDAWIRI